MKTDYRLTPMQHASRILFALVSYYIVFLVPTYAVAYIADSVASRFISPSTSFAIGVNVGLPVMVWYICYTLPRYTITLPANAGAVFSNNLYGLFLSLIGVKEKMAAQISFGGSATVVVYFWENKERFYTLGTASVGIKVTPNAAKVVVEVVQDPSGNQHAELVRKHGEGVRMEAVGSIQIEPKLELLPLFHAAMQADPGALAKTAADMVSSHIGGICQELLPYEINANVSQIAVQVTMDSQNEIMMSTGKPFQHTFGAEIVMITLADFEAPLEVQKAWDAEAINEAVLRQIEANKGAGMDVAQAKQLASLASKLTTLNETQHTQRTIVDPVQDPFGAIMQLLQAIGTGSSAARRTP